MRCYFQNLHHTLIYMFLVICVMCMIKIDPMISLLLDLSLVFSLVIQWEKRDIKFMTWNHTKFLHHKMPFFMKTNFLFILINLRKNQTLLFLYPFLILWRLQLMCLIVITHQSNPLELILMMILPHLPTSNAVSSDTLYPISCHLSYSRFVPSHQAFLANISIVSEPKSFSQTVTNPKWCEAMKQEISALEQNHTSSLVPLPS